MMVAIVGGGIEATELDAYEVINNINSNRYAAGAA